MKEKIVTYPAIFKPIEDNVYFISFPDVKGAVTEGHGLKDAFKVAADALGTILFDEKKLPKMTDSAEKTNVSKVLTEALRENYV